MENAQRVAILVDSENLEISVSKYYVPPKGMERTHLPYPNWIEIIPKILKGRLLTRNIYYKKKEKSVSKKFKSLWERELSGEIKQPVKSVDPYIIVDAISLAEKVDTIILLAGDKDYLPLIWYLKSKGCKVEMAAFPDAASTRIKASADVFYTLKARDTVVIKKSELSTAKR